MELNNNLKYKKGSISIIILSITFVVFLFIILCVFYTLFQINFITNVIKKDMHYICQNIYKNLDKDGLSYNKIELNIENSKSLIEELINKNHKNYNIKITNLNYREKYLNVKFSYNIVPIVLRDKIGIIKINIIEGIE